MPKLGKRLMSILNKFFNFRKKSGLTQKELGKKLGIAQGYLSDIENGRKVPSDTLDLLFELTARAWEGTNKIQNGSMSLIDVNENQEWDAMYREKYLDLLEKHILLQEEVNRLREQSKKAIPTKLKKLS